MEKYLNIVSFNIPWPANYGGVIDVFYKIKALHTCGIKIILHCFEYERPQAEYLKQFCERIYYYKRHTGLLTNLSLLPYNVFSRKNKALLKNLEANDYPILFEGLHSCYYLPKQSLSNRFKVIRQCNIEHHYYKKLAAVEPTIWKRLFFLIEAFRMERFNKVTFHTELTLSVSLTETKELQAIFPQQDIRFIPCFHENKKITSLAGKSDYILYHGKLSVGENREAVLFLIQEVFSKLPYRCIIAGMDPSENIYNAANRYSNIEIVANPDMEAMNQLIQNAQIHLMLTNQATGLKLKILNSLFQGRHVIANELMLKGTGLEPLCHICNTPEDIIQACHKLMAEEFDQKDIEKRKEVLFPQYDNIIQAQKIIDLIYKPSSSNPSCT